MHQIPHNAPFVTEMCTFLLQNDALWDMGPMHCGVCATGLLEGICLMGLIETGKWITLLSGDALLI